MELNFALIISIMSALVSMSALYKFYDARRRDAMAEGARQEQAKQRQESIQRAFERIGELERSDRKSSEGIIEMRGDIKHILAAVERLERKLDEHIVSHNEAD